MAKKNILSKLKVKKAQQFVQENKLAEAKNIYLQICQSNNSDVNSLLELSLINRKLGFYKESEKYCRDIISSDPSNARAYHILGSALQCMGKLPEAIESYNKAISLDKANVETWYLLGNAQREAADLPGAAESYRKAVEINPDFLEALGNLGATLQGLGNLDESLSVLNRALLIRPDSVQVLCSLAVVMMNMDDIDQALKLLLKAQSISPQFFDVQRLLASVYKELGEYEKALSMNMQALKQAPENEVISASMAAIYERQGEYVKAYEIIQPFIESNTTNTEMLIVYSKLSAKLNLVDDAIEMLENSILANETSQHDKIEANYELGRRYDKTEKYDQAFEHYSAANNLTREINTELIKQTNNNFGLSKELNYLKNCDKSDNQSDMSVFIIGMLRSGSTLTEQILSSHPDIYGAGEVIGSKSINQNLGLNSQSEYEFKKIHENLNSNKLDDLANKYLDNLQKLPVKNVKRVVDSVRTNFNYLALVSRMFPNSKVIHTTREPLDNCLSIYFQQLGPTLTYYTDLTEIGRYYLRHLEIMKAYREALNLDVYEVKYENMVADMEGVSKKMIEFCGLEWDSACLDFFNNKRDVSTPSYDQVRQPIYNKSVARYKSYEKHLGDLKEVLGVA